MAFEARIDGDPAQSAAAAQGAEAWCLEQGVDMARALRLVLALDELVVNALTHGRTDPSPDITIRVDVDGPRLILTIRAAGPAFDPWAPRDTAEVPEDYLGGRGLMLVRGFAEEVGYRREGEYNVTIVAIAPDDAGA